VIESSQWVEVLNIDLRIYSNTHFIWSHNVLNVSVIGQVARISGWLASPEAVWTH